ncbi:MAG: hypothetical protein Q9Q40_15000, partial [Acidobacteriota bacterium]|nr:hypothetical protein [Acidobacteriota bacterium]
MNSGTRWIPAVIRQIQPINSRSRRTQSLVSTTAESIYITPGATDPWQEVIPDSAGTPGIEYNVAGGIHRLRYGNGT